MWCGDYSGVIRGRSLSTGVLDGTTIEHQRGRLSALDVVDADGRPVLVSLGRNAASIGRWAVDGTGPITRRIIPGHALAPGYSPDGRWLLLGGPPADGATDGFSPSLWNADTDQQVNELPTDKVQEAVWLETAASPPSPSMPTAAGWTS